MKRPDVIDLAQERIDAAASEWIVLAADRALTPGEQARLDAWLAADPRHRETWQALSRTWGEIPAMTGLAALAPLDTAGPDADMGAAGAPRRWTVRFAGLAAVAAALAVLFFAPTLRHGDRAQFATEIAQTRLLTLPDGTQVMLGPRSALKVAFAEGERRVVLTGGEAFFEVVHDGRPFLVEAGTSLIRVLGTKFDVNFGARSVRVAVLEGLVEVSVPGTAAAPPQRLRAGQRAEVVLSAPADEIAAVSVPPAVQPALAPGAWREGRLVYEDTRLADLVADINRYYAPGVTLGDPAVGELRVTAAFKASEIPAFLGVIGDVVPVEVNAARDGTFRLETARD